MARSALSFHWYVVALPSVVVGGSQVFECVQARNPDAAIQAVLSRYGVPFASTACVYHLPSPEVSFLHAIGLTLRDDVRCLLSCQSVEEVK